MANYGLPKKDLEKKKQIYKNCVYCGKLMIKSCKKDSRRDWATIEHLHRFGPWNDPTWVVNCCYACNCSRGQKKIKDWFKSKYCIKNNINENTVADIVKEYLATNISNL